MKNIFRLMLILAFLVSNPLLALSEKVEKPICEFLQLDDHQSIDLQINFVDLSMENSKQSLENQNRFITHFDEATPVDFDAYESINTRLTITDWLRRIKSNQSMETFGGKLYSDFQSKKEELILSKIRKYIPDFNFQDELKNPTNSFYSEIIDNQTCYFLEHQGHKIRLITFVTKSNPIKIDNENKSISLNIEEYYY